MLPLAEDVLSGALQLLSRIEEPGARLALSLEGSRITGDAGGKCGLRLAPHLKSHHGAHVPVATAEHAIDASQLIRAHPVAVAPLACPTCRNRGDNFSRYADNVADIMAAIAEARKVNQVAVVRRIDRPGIYHIGGVDGICNSAQDLELHINRTYPFRWVPGVTAEMKPTDVLYISYRDMKHQLLTGDDHEVETQLRRLIES